MPNISHVQRSCAMPEEKMHKNLTKSNPNFMNKRMELMSGMLEGGNRDKADNLIGTLSNRKQAMGDVTKCGGKFRQTNKKCSTV